MRKVDTDTLISLHDDSEEFDGSGAEVSGPGVRHVPCDGVQNRTQQHTVLFGEEEGGREMRLDIEKDVVRNR